MKHRAGDTEWIKSFYDSAAGWWGESWYEGQNLAGRLKIVQQFAPAADQRILELAAGTGETAAYLCDHGYPVLAVDLARKNIELMRKYQATRPNLRVLEGDILELSLSERFPTVCMFESFGFGADREQQALLRKIDAEWLSPGGVLILDVYNAFGPIRASGSRHELDRLENVPGSVDMIEYSYYDPVNSRWIDIWEPKQDPQNRKMQSIRCYTPADFLLLAQGCGLAIEAMLYNSQPFAFDAGEITYGDELFDPSAVDASYAYTVVMRKRR